MTVSLTCNVFSATRLYPFDGEPYPLDRLIVTVDAPSLDEAFSETKARLAEKYGTTPEYVHITGVSRQK